MINNKTIMGTRALLILLPAFAALIFSAAALASRTKLAVKRFKCAWFDDKHYYGFFPLHAVYRRDNNRENYD